MPIETPENAIEVDQRARTDVARVVTGSNPFLPNTFWGGLISSFANRIFDFYSALQEAIRESIPDTAIRLLDRWSAIWGVVRIKAAPSAGNLDIRGLLGTQVLLGTIWVGSDGKRYIGQAASSGMIAVSLTIDKMERVGSTVTCTTDAPHNLAGNEDSYALAISGSGTAQFNQDPLVDLAITGEKTLTFTSAAGADDDPSAATLALSNILNGADVMPVVSLDTGTAVNQVLNAPLTLEQPIAGILDDAHVNFGGVAGGIGQEENDDLRERYLELLQNPVAHFNAAEITATAKLVSGVTRVFVEKVTPALGQVTVYFTRDNDDTQIPDASEVTTVKTALIGGTAGGVIYPGISPSNTADDDVIVSAPTAVPEDFDFTALAPDTPEMREAVVLNLQQFFAEDTTVSVAVPEEAYTAAIFNTVDPVTGDSVTSFTLSTPSGDLAAASGELVTLGTVSFTI